MPTSRDIPDGAASGFHCTAPGCTYSKRDACGIVLHMRTHFVYETAEKEMPKATFLLKDGFYRCLDCDRRTDSQLSFREHVRHHILPFPYRCHCGTTVSSIPDLRRHSSSTHPKTPLQMYFEDAEQLLDDIFTEIGTDKRTFWFPQRIAEDSSAEVENLSDLHDANPCGSVLNESNVADIEITDHAASKTSVCRTNTEPKQKENCCMIPSATNSDFGKGASSASVSVLEFSTEFNYINAFQYSSATTASEPSSGFCVLNVPDDGLDESRTDCLEDVVQLNTTKSSNLPIKWQWLPHSGSTSSAQSADNSPLLVRHNIDSRSTVRDVTLSNSSSPHNRKDNGQKHVELDSNLLTVFPRVTGRDSEVPPNRQDNRMENELESISLAESGPASGPGKFVFRDQKFKCLTCLRWESFSEQLFKKHVWQHFHSISRICNKVDCQSTDCPLVLGMVMLVKSCRPSTGTSEYPSPSTPSLPVSHVRKPSNISSKRSALDNLCDVEPSSPTNKSFAAQRKNSKKVAEKKSTNRNLFENLTSNSAEHLRFSAPTLSSLRSKACKHLHFNSKRTGDLTTDNEKFQRHDRDIDVGNCGEEVACVSSTELARKESTENPSAAVSEENGISPRRRKQTLVIKHDGNKPVEYCRYSRDSIPLSTVCLQCSYTCNCSDQLSWHIESCHPKLPIRKKKEYCCTECDFSDNSKDTLIWHLAHHIGEHSLRVYSCRYCSKQSTYMSRVMKHIYHDHPGKVLNVEPENTNIAYMDGIFKCPFCSSGYPWGSLFFRHIEVQHELKDLADHLARAYGKKCCPEVIDFPKYLIRHDMPSEISKENQSPMDKSACNESATSCTEDENVSKIVQLREDTTDSLESSHSKNCTETDDRANDIYTSEPDTPQNRDLKGKTISRNASFSSAKSADHAGSVDVRKNKGNNQTFDAKTNSGKPGKNLNRLKGNINHWTLQPNTRKLPQNDMVYNSNKRNFKKYQSPKAGKRSFLISPTCVPTLPRNVGNHTASDFEKSLPNEFIFSEAIKCPKCYYTDRIRLNLIRHYNGHSTDASRGVETSEVSNVQPSGGNGVTFALWNPKKSLKQAPESNKLVSNKRKNLAFAAKEKDKERLQKASQKGQSERWKRPVKRARLTDEAAKCHDSDSNTASPGVDEKTKRGSVTGIDDSVPGQSLATSGDTRTASASLGSSPAFGQFLQNHARKTVATHTCESCSTTFSNETEYEKHAKDVHSSTYYLCRCCGTMIRGLPNVQLHFKENHPGSQVLVDKWVSAAPKESEKRIRPFSDLSDVGLPAKKMKMSRTDADKGKLPEKSDAEKEESSKGQRWSSFYGANLRKQGASNTVQNPTVGAANDEFSAGNMTTEVSSSNSFQTTCAATVSLAYNTSNTSTTVGNNENALSAPGSKLMTSMASPSVPTSSFPPPMAGNLFATFMTNLLAANMMTNQTFPATQVPAMQAMGAQLPSSVQPSAPVAMAGSSLPAPGIQPAVDTSGFANLLVHMLMANLAAGTGMTAPAPYPNKNAPTPGSTAYPFQPAANTLNLLGPNANPQHAPSMPELIKEALYPSYYGSNMHSIGAPGSDVSVQNDNRVTNVLEDMPTLVPGASCVNMQDSSLRSASKPMYAATGGSKTNRLSTYDSLYSSEAESTISCVSQRSSISKSSGSTIASNKSLKRRAGTEKQRKNKYIGSDSEKGDSDSEICSSIGSVSTTDLSKKELHCRNSSPLSLAESFADRSIRMCCNMCAFKTRRLDYFERHLAGHFNSRQPPVDPKHWQPVRQKCGFCNFQTYLDDEFEDHIAMHTIKKPFQCWYCPFSGFKNVAVNRHLKRFHPELEPKVKKNQNVRLKQTTPHDSVTKVSLNAAVKLNNVLNLSNKALKRLCNKYQLLKLHLKKNRCKKIGIFNSTQYGVSF